ncbi:MAG: hypothetical protein AAF999_06465 [Pseudomonadota bacterium]
MQVIAAFSAAPEVVTPQGRQLRGDAAGSAHAMLGEIDETVLRRTLLFSSDHDATLALDVGERRLLTVLSVSEPLGAAYSGIVGRPLEVADAPQVMSLLADFGAQNRSVFVRSRPSESIDADVYQGLSAKMLSEQQPSALPEGLPAALRHAVVVAADDCDALVICDAGTSIYQRGEAKRTDGLAAHMSQIASGQGALREVTLWCGAPSGGAAVLVAVLDRFGVALCGPSDRLREHFPLWQEAVTRS